MAAAVSLSWEQMRKRHNEYMKIKRFHFPLNWPPPSTLSRLYLPPDLFDLIPLTIEAERPNFTNMTHHEIERYTQTNGHCSALVKLTGDFQDLFMSHSSWFRYQAMTRIMKHCKPGAVGDFRYGHRAGDYDYAHSSPVAFAHTDNLPGGPSTAKKITFSSYPG
jgi:hypothetical protein